jgi:hypothetical protein
MSDRLGFSERRREELKNVEFRQRLDVARLAAKAAMRAAASLAR